MRTVRIYYNPYLETTRFFVDDLEHNLSGKRIDEFIVGQPLESWLYPYVKSYRKWDGILCELMEDLNDDELQITYYGLPEYFEEFSNELQKQVFYVEEKGYVPDLWSLTQKEYYLPEKVQKDVAAFIQAKKRFLPDQHSMNLMEYVEMDLRELSDDHVKKLKQIHDNLRSVIDVAKKACGKKSAQKEYEKIWESANKELTRVFGGVHRDE